MAISCSNKDAVETYFSKVLDIVSYEVKRSLAFLGEKCVTRIKDRGWEISWIDHTGNLRSSIGYAIYEYGREYIRSTFRQILEGSDGVSKGNRMLDELARKYSDTYALVVVAGMEYADLVEARDSKDVLASTELWAKQEIDSVMKNCLSRIEREVKKL
jgi:hypothetical protein